MGISIDNLPLELQAGDLLPAVQPMSPAAALCDHHAIALLPRPQRRSGHVEHARHRSDRVDRSVLRRLLAHVV
jgi:hypothetical protein